MGILLWVLFGLIAGAIAKFLMPGKAPGGIIVTILLGIVGAVVGGFIGSLFGFGDITGFNLWSMLLAVGGGVLVLFIYGLVTRARADDPLQAFALATPAIVYAPVERKWELAWEKVHQGQLGGAAIGCLCKHNAVLSGQGDEQSRFGWHPRPWLRSI